jgi:hypothetical protein
MCLFLLNQGQWSTTGQPDSMSIYYLVFVAVEAIIVILAVRRQLRDFLGIHEARKIPVLAVLASLLSMFSGVLLVALEIAYPITRPMSVSSYFAYFMGDVTILAGLVVAIGGVLILLKSYILGALMSILCGIYPRPPEGYHAFDFISNAGFPAFVAVAIGALPIIGGAIALFYVMRKIRF